MKLTKTQQEQVEAQISSARSLSKWFSSSYGFPFDEALAIAYESLCHAALTHVPTQSPFKNYANLVMKHDLMNVVQKESLRRQGRVYDLPAKEGGSSMDEYFEENQALLDGKSTTNLEDNAYHEELLSSLSPKEIEVVIKLLSGCSVREISNDTGLSSGAIRWLKSRLPLKFATNIPEKPV